MLVFVYSRIACYHNMWPLCLFNVITFFSHTFVYLFFFLSFSRQPCYIKNIQSSKPCSYFSFQGGVTQSTPESKTHFLLILLKYSSRGNYSFYDPRFVSKDELLISISPLLYVLL